MVHQLSVVKTLNGTNYDDWFESLQMYLIISRDDLAMREPKPSALTEQSNETDKTQSIPEKEIATEFLKAISDKYKKFEKSKKTYYLSLLDNTRFDGVSRVREHIMKLLNYFNKLKGLKVDHGESYLVYRILESLPAEYGVLRTTYNSQECEWSIDQMISIMVQEEESQKKAKSLTQSVNNLTLGSSSKNGNEKRKGKKFDKKKKSFGPKKNDFKVKGKGKMKEGFKGECFYCKKYGHRIADCFKLRKKNEKEADPSVSESSVAASVNTVVGHKQGRLDENSSTLWHRRLGHISRERLERLVKQGILHDLDFSDFDSCVHFRSDRGGDYYGKYTVSDSGSEAPRTIKLHNEDTLLIMPSIPSSSTTHVPTRAHDNIEVPVDVNPTDYVQDEQVIEPPINEVQEQVLEPVVNLRRSDRNRKSAIPNDYYVYLQEFKSDIIDGTDPIQ
ncbi:Retrovirus-related Pol polyprotein from transposon TNT 1-94 [Senna tora]|uniref:Retrovirus-related Pol polyprotein from transposon TNT 1-94 n=1 Tax=Senna tora TaxID=362788 RepID=A0A834SGD3_9FABA|nr:Retrovirus-related Pol polyprotein from transposon TNT 1-94 [Senna tora]